MADEPDDLVAAVARAEDAFGGQLGRPDYEEGLDPDAHDADVIQLRKACRLFDACRLLRDHDGYHTSVIEMSFAAIERTLEFYALTASNDTVDDFERKFTTGLESSARAIVAFGRFYSWPPRIRERASPTHSNARGTV